MKLFAAVWHFRPGAPGTWTDKTALADSDMALTIQTADELYLGMDDWTSGILFFLSAYPSAVGYTISLWDGDDWRAVHLEDVYQTIMTGHTFDRAFTFKSDGAAYWGRSPYAWGLDTPSAASNWPKTENPPNDVTTEFWIRISFSSVAGTLTLKQARPLMYNTYAAYNHVAQFLSLPSFTDVTAPEVSVVRHAIRDQEDWLDQYCRRTWRYKMVWGETHDFNPYGMRLRIQPPQMVMNVGLWQGTAFEAMREGRGKDWFLDPYSGMFYFMLPSFRLRYYSFLLSRYLRQPRSVSIDYLAGQDFETSPQMAEVQHIILRLVGADLARNSDQTGWLSSGLNELSKSEKVREWYEVALERADHLRYVVIL
jgi:hypothetical protein